METKRTKLSAECNLQQIEERVSDFERITKEAKARNTLSGADIEPLTNFLFLLRDPDCIGIKFSPEQIKRINEAYLLLNSYYSVPENPGTSFEILKQIMEARKYVEQLLSRSEARG
jgi:hypothetical protein